MVELITSPLESDHSMAQSLFMDWSRARGRMFTELCAKLAHWQQLPWKLLGLAHHRPEEARRTAKQCLFLWQRGGLGTRHRQSRRFLDPGYNNGPNDPALYPLVKMVAEGAPIQSPLMDPMISWLGRFRLLRVAERRVEGIHSQVTHCIKRARRASTAYISIELRFKDFWNFIARNPGVASHT